MSIQQLVNEFMSTVPELQRSINNRIVTTEDVRRVSNELAQLLNDRQAMLNDTPQWNNMSDDQRLAFKERVAKNPLWVSQTLN